jgi:hypothetical protein
MVLADVSAVGRDSVSSEPYRNGHVMYEVGIALAVRQPSEVLLVRDDNERFLFDVSTVPHLRVDFTREDAAQALLVETMVARLRERRITDDARTQMALLSLTTEEVQQLRYVATMPPDHIFGPKQANIIDFVGLAVYPRLLDKQLIQVAGTLPNGNMAYAPTRIGRAVAQFIVTAPAFNPKPGSDEQKPPDTGPGSP